ncbi:putative Uncharacterized HTH-type transcriptional regulator YdcR (plasmid) [Cupriavidus taiwanensis]|uniref:Putative Uncharacterized HTH-type transcriptional regulator YdcR n=2 Tax=Cupriavidus taiwanensis TaxID=164546 RepID=A0A375IMY7_9BURK|nr:putative Uncharacterized HTH-type transcriptional regulator YdcR [Cupriavidus taiwanensis]
MPAITTGFQTLGFSDACDRPRVRSRYEELAKLFIAKIDSGVYKPGDRLPSLRQASQHHYVSIATVVRAYLLLESSGHIQSRPQSGYFVRAQGPTLSLQGRPLNPSPRTASEEDRKSRPSALTCPDFNPDPLLLPWRTMNRYAFSLCRRNPELTLQHIASPGSDQLIRAVARRYMDTGIPVDPREVVIVDDNQEALALSLHAVARPGDIIAIESPIDPAVCFAVQRLGMVPLEVSSHPLLGMDVSELAERSSGSRPAACVVTSNFHASNGSQISIDRLRQLACLSVDWNMPVIEFDPHRELHFSDTGAPSLRHLPGGDRFIHCSTLSACLGPTHSISWILGGRHTDSITRLQRHTPQKVNAWRQLTVRDFLERESLDYLLRRLRKTLWQRARIMASAIVRFFPKGTRVWSPAGGTAAWVELADTVDATAVAHCALQLGLPFIAGSGLTSGTGFRNCFAVNFTYAFDMQRQMAVMAAGRLAFGSASVQPSAAPA